MMAPVSAAARISAKMPVSAVARISAKMSASARHQP